METENLLVELNELVRSRFFGKYRGLVRKVDDKENMGRIVALVPAIYGDEESPWAMPSVPFAGKDHGLLLIPEIGDGVWIEFEGGSPSCPIWTGCWWAKGELPDPGGKSTRVLKTAGGHQLVLDDAGKKVQLRHAGGAEITLEDKTITLKIGSTQVVMSSTGVDINSGSFVVK